MSKPLSVNLGATLSTTLALLGTAASADTAVSAEANALRKSVVQVRTSFERSEALFGAKANAITQLWDLANECSIAGWDGSGASPIDRSAVFNAVALIRAMPDRLPLPEFAVEPDGSISLDWIQSRTRLFSISVSARDRLAFAWYDGSDQGHGVAAFNQNIVPQRVVDGINSIIGNIGASIRAL